MNSIEVSTMQSVRPYYVATALFVLWWLLFALFYTYPQIDQEFTRLFFQSSACTGETGTICGSFPLSENLGLRIFRQFAYYLPPAIALGMLVWLVRNFKQRNEPHLQARHHNVSLIFWTWIINVLVIVNLGLKANSGRPRPYDTDLFGGQHVFAAAGDFSGACTVNCSFISGEAASAGWLMCLLLLLPVRYQKSAILPVLLFSLLIALLRAAFGGHYLSDISLGWLSSAVVCALLLSVFGWRKQPLSS